MAGETIDKVPAARVDHAYQIEKGAEEFAEGVKVGVPEVAAYARGVAEGAGISTGRNIIPSLTALMGLDDSAFLDQFPAPPADVVARATQGHLIFSGGETVAAGEMAVAAIKQMIDRIKIGEGGATAENPLVAGIVRSNESMAQLGMNVQGYTTEFEELR
jgi:hypothetical protein